MTKQMTKLNTESLDTMIASLRHAGYRQTCLPFRPVDDGITFVKHAKHFDALLRCTKSVFAFIPWGQAVDRLPKNVQWLVCESPGLEFALVHNELCDKRQVPPIIGGGGVVHETAIIGTDGVWLADTPDGHRIRMISSGHLLICNRVDIGAYSVIHHGLVYATFLDNCVKIGAKCSIGHDVIIGEGSIISTGTTIGGCCEIGNRVFLGLNSTIKNEVSICDNVMIGAGAVVIHDITEPGRYAGVPARQLVRL